MKRPDTSELHDTPELSDAYTHLEYAGVRIDEALKIGNLLASSGRLTGELTFKPEI